MFFFFLGPSGPKGGRGDCILGEKGVRGDRGEPGVSINGDRGLPGDPGDPGMSYGSYPSPSPPVHVTQRPPVFWPSAPAPGTPYNPCTLQSCEYQGIPAGYGSPQYAGPTYPYSHPAGPVVYQGSQYPPGIVYGRLARTSQVQRDEEAEPEEHEEEEVEEQEENTKPPKRANKKKRKKNKNRRNNESN